MQLSNAATTTEPAPRRRNRPPNPPRIKPDGRVRSAKRHKDIVAELTAMIGGAPDAGQQYLIEVAAALRIEFEALSRAQQRGETVDTGRLLKLSGQLNRCLSSLRRTAKAKVAPAGPSLAEYLARRSSAKPAQTAGGEPGGGPA